jgi:hypothetical protein
VCRHHNSRASALLRLPDNALEFVARKMGKRARLLCSRLRSLHGSPGAVLRPQPTLYPRHDEATQTACMVAAIRSWQHREAVRRLVLDDTVVDGPACCAITEVMPGLRELACRVLDPARNSPAHVPIAAHTALTSLCTTTATDIAALATFAPRLQSLEVKETADTPEPEVMWSALASLRALQHLELPLEGHHLYLPDAVPSAMQQLTGLTHLALRMTGSAVDKGLDEEDVLELTDAVAALPQLVSLKLAEFRALGAPLGPALQALRWLTRLDLKDAQWLRNKAHPSLTGCFPEISAMPCLQHLTLSGERVVGSDDLLRACGGGSTSLKALELLSVGRDVLPAACAVMSQNLPGLTMLNLQVWCWPPSPDELAFHEHDQLLTNALSRHPHLRHLEVQAEELGFVPWLTTLTALSCLELRFERSGLMRESELEVVGSLTSLKKLALGHVDAPGLWGLCGEAARKLPLLEELEVRYNSWWGVALELLVPPPERLKRITGAQYRSQPVPWGHVVVEELNSYGVYVDYVSKT